MSFSADFSIQGDVAYANEKIQFTSTALTGLVVDSEDLEIDGDVVKDEVLASGNFICSVITSITWETPDGLFFSGEELVHTFSDSGVLPVKISAFSEYFEYSGKLFRFKVSISKDVTIFSKFFKFIVDRYPMWASEKNDATEDLFYSAAQFFERIYNDIKETLKNIDPQLINPNLFEYMALTFGHNKDYIKKIGADVNTDEFDSYDIYEKIRTNKATAQEIKTFRQFLLFSSQLFKGKGTTDGVKKFLSFFTIDAKVVELWTEHWGLVTKGVTDETFAGLEKFIDNKLGLRWDVRVIGNNNDVGHFIHDFNSFSIDNYHISEKLEYKFDVVSYVTSGSNKDGWAEFEISYGPEKIIDIRRENGSHLTSDDEVSAEFYDIVENIPVRNDPSKKFVLQVNTNILEHGDRISISYKDSNEEIHDSLVASTKEKIKDLDIYVKYRVKDIPIEEKNTNFRLPEDEVFVVFRGTTAGGDLSSDFDVYYRLSLNFRRSVVSLEKVIRGDGGKLVTQKINLSSDKNNKVFDKFIIDDSTSDFYKFTKESIYELKLSVTGSSISSYFREASIDNEIESKIDSDTGDIPFGEEETNEFVELFSNVSVDVDDSSILSVNQNGEETLSYGYTEIKDAGYIGVGCRTSNVQFLSMVLDNMDLDSTLYSTEDKEINIKPRYLEWLNRKLVKYNSYPNNVQSFTKPVENPFDKDTKDYTITEQEKDSLEFLYFDAANVSEEIASRYTVVFDKEWVGENFTSEIDVMKKIILPIGSQTSWFLPESRIHNKNVYSNYYGTSSTVWTATQPPTSDSTTVTASGYIPGFYNYDLTVPWEKYKTEPLDEFSSMERSDENFGNVLYINDKTSQYKLSSNSFTIKGVFEEVSPFSTYFEELDGQKKLPDSSSYKNKVFLPITFNTSSYRRLLGVRFKNCSDIKTIIDRATFEFQNEIQLYGSFSIHLPEACVKFRPNRHLDLRPSTVKKNHYIGKFFVPLGVLNESIQNYSLGAEFMHLVENSGATDIWMNGVFFRIPKNKLIYRDSLNELEMESTSPFENREKELYCQHFLSAELDLGCSLEDCEKPLDETVVPNKYLLKYGVRNFLKQLENSNNYNYNTDYLWWIPKQVLRKRDFTILETDVTKDIVTGINFVENSGVDKAFYGTKFLSSTSSPKFLKIKINDGAINPNTVYSAKITVRINYSGFEQSKLNRDSGEGHLDRPLSGVEYDTLKILGGIKNTYDDGIMAPVKECLDFYVPISWYPDGSQPVDSVIEWSNFIRGTYGTATSPTLTVAPYGLMTWLIQHSGLPNAVEIESNLNQVTSGWTLKDWNDRFRDLVKIESIVEIVPPDKYKLYDQFGFVSKYAPNNGSYVEVEYDIGSVDWKVYSKVNLIPKEISSYYFNIPRDVYSLKEWVTNVKSLKIYNFILPQKFYNFTSPTTFTLIDDVLFEIFDGSKFNGRYFFDIFFDSKKYEVLRDDFSKERNITWTVYENTSESKFELSTRSPSESIVFGSEDPTYEIVQIEGKYSFKRLENKTLSKFDPKKSGSNKAKDISSISLDDNGGYSQMVYIIDSKNEVFDIEANVFFDETLNDEPGYNGKKFEFVVKSNSSYNPLTKKYNLSEYYFVGIGTYNFDISIGVARYNFTTNKVEKTFLAGFGQYNTRSIKTGTWYKLKVVADSKYIKVIFNESVERDRQVLTYCIDPARQTDSDKYLKGEFEELVYLTSGLKSLDITYPDKLAETSSQTFFDSNWNESLARTVRPVGPFSGFRVFNDKTYITNITYRAKIEDDRRYGEVHDITDYSGVVSRIKTIFNIEAAVDYVGKTLSGTIVVKQGENLLYRKGISDPVLYTTGVDKVFVHKNVVIIKYNNDSKIQMTIVDENFKFERNVYVKDSGINSDHIYKYLLYTQRGISDIFITDDYLHVIMKNIQG